MSGKCPYVVFVIITAARGVARIATVGCLLVLVAVSAHATPRVNVTTQDVAGTAYGARHRIVIYAVERVPQLYGSRHERVVDFVTTDDAGAFSWHAPNPIPEESVWVAIDTLTGDFAAGIPSSARWTPGRIHAPQLVSAGDAASGQALLIDRFYVQVLLLRRGQGAWAGDAMRHARGDLNHGRTGTVRVDPTLWRDVSKAHAPIGQITPSDVIVVVDPASMDFYVGPAAEARQ